MGTDGLPTKQEKVFWNRKRKRERPVSRRSNIWVSVAAGPENETEQSNNLRTDLNRIYTNLVSPGFFQQSSSVASSP